MNAKPMIALETGIFEFNPSGSLTITPKVRIDGGPAGERQPFTVSASDAQKLVEFMAKQAEGRPA